VRIAAFLMGITMATGASAQDRFPELKPEEMTPAQKEVADAITSGPRGSIRGPFNAWLRSFNAWLRSPELADRLQKVGEHIRYKSSLPPRLNEFAILITARHWNAKFEWYAHYPLAIRGGLKPEVAADLAKGLKPRGMAADEAAVYDFCIELRRDRKVSDTTFAAVQKLFGDQGVVDLIGVNGYYDLVSMTLNVAEVATPPDGELPLPDLP
jgi:4-carboxymuconolactone decarboxylase